VGPAPVRGEAGQPGQQAQVHVIVVGTGLAGASAAASLGELGYNVLCFCIHDSPRRAHSIAAQGGINAAKNYKNDGDSIQRLFYDTIKGGDYRAREANVYRLAQLSVNIIDQCVAQGVPFAREYGGMLDNRSFGGAQVSRTFYARGQTGQQLLLGAYQALMRQVAAGSVRLMPRREMLDLVVVDGKARGIVTRNLITGELESYAAHAVCLATGGLRHCVLPLDQRGAVERDGGVAGAQARGVLREPVLHADSPDLHPRERRAPVEAHAHERVAQERRARVGAEEPGRHPAARADPGR
jgi:succinate dehydrogenase/fumarate reductase flavoprotein subunit